MLCCYLFMLTIVRKCRKCYRHKQTKKPKPIDPAVSNVSGGAILGGEQLVFQLQDGKLIEKPPNTPKRTREGTVKPGMPRRIQKILQEEWVVSSVCMHTLWYTMPMLSFTC